MLQLSLLGFHLQQGSKCNLITFDNHTDTLAPLLAYKNSSLKANEEIFISELNHMRNNLTETLLKGLLTPGSHLKGRNVVLMEKHYIYETMSI